MELKRIELSHKPCKGPSPALEHATPIGTTGRKRDRIYKIRREKPTVTLFFPKSEMLPYRLVIPPFSLLIVSQKESNLHHTSVMLTLKNFDDFAVNLISGYPAVHMPVIVSYQILLVISDRMDQMQVVMSSHLT